MATGNERQPQRNLTELLLEDPLFQLVLNRPFALANAPAYILWLIREQRATTLSDLYRYLNLVRLGTTASVYSSPGEQDYVFLLELQAILYQLREAGLLSIEECELTVEDQRLSGWLFEREMLLAVTECYRRCQSLLRFSLQELIRQQMHLSVVAQPIFGPPRRDLANRDTDLFVVMPFSEELNSVYSEHITSVARELELTVVRGDDLFSLHEIMADIWRRLTSSRVIIADCTGRNPNVFYEIGIAHTYGTPVILITQSMEDIPFDLNQRRCIVYDLSEEGTSRLQTNLRAAIVEVLQLTE